MAFRSLTIMLICLLHGLSQTNYRSPLLEWNNAGEVNQEELTTANDSITVRENMVVFLVLSQKDADFIVSRHAELKDIIAEKLSDFYTYSEMLAEALKKVGIVVEFAARKRILFEYADGRTQEMRFDPNDIYGMAMLARGKPAMLVTAFGAFIEPMAKIISEYFQIKIKW